MGYVAHLKLVNLALIPLPFSQILGVSISIIPQGSDLVSARKYTRQPQVAHELLATVLRETFSPCACRSACTLGDPYTPSEAVWDWVIFFANSSRRSSCLEGLHLIHA